MTYHVALTGHRPSKLAKNNPYNLDQPYYTNMFTYLLKRLESSVQHHGEIVCHSGMALGADTVWSAGILAIRACYPNQVTFIAHVPFTGQELRWKPVDITRYRKHCQLADEVITYGTSYDPALMKARNTGMVKACDVLVVVWDGSTGGTSHAVNQAENLNKTIHQVNPRMFDM